MDRVPSRRRSLNARLWTSTTTSTLLVEMRGSGSEATRCASASFWSMPIRASTAPPVPGGGFTRHRGYRPRGAQKPSALDDFEVSHQNLRRGIGTVAVGIKLGLVEADPVDGLQPGRQLDDGRFGRDTAGRLRRPGTRPVVRVGSNSNPGADGQCAGHLVIVSRCERRPHSTDTSASRRRVHDAVQESPKGPGVIVTPCQPRSWRSRMTHERQAAALAPPPDHPHPPR